MYISVNEKNKCDSKIVLVSTKLEKTNDDSIDKVIEYISENRGYTGKYDEIASFDFVGQQTPEKYVVAGIGESIVENPESVRVLFSHIASETAKEKCVDINVDISFLNGRDEETVYNCTLAIVEGFALASYRYDKYMQKKKQVTIKSLDLIADDSIVETVKLAVEEASTLIDATLKARDLINEPANNQFPELLGEQAKAYCDAIGLECEVYDNKHMEELGMHAALAVGQASPNKPRLIVIRHKGNPDSDKTLCLVGKGITFDSGGLSLKNKSRLPHMKHDMAGSAAVIGAILAIKNSNLKVNVTAIVAACENLLSGDGYRPGDVISSMRGKSIEVISTDGEGRLTLADALTYAIKNEGADYAIDIATLTGGARAFFGGFINPILCNDDEMVDVLDQASAKSGERFHRLPLMPEARQLLTSKVADIKNSSPTPYLRMQQGGMFVHEFVQDECSWLHIDMSGSGLADFNRDYVPQGGTGRGVRSLYHFAKIMADMI